MVIIRIEYKKRGVFTVNNFSEAFQSLHQAAVQRERSAHVIHHEMDGQLMLKIHRTQLKPAEEVINERGVIERNLISAADRIVLKQFESMFSNF